MGDQYQTPRRLDHPACLEILSWLEQAGGPSRYVGGCVRDHLIRRPFYDIDLATPLLAEDVMAVMSSKGVKVIPTGLQHGTVTLVHKEEVFEVTTLRKDVATDGRHAEVAFTDDWHEDAKRRDFTMNSLSMDRDANVYDPFDGLADLKAGRLVFVGDPRKRIEEDYLRLLRFFRFGAHYAKQNPSNDVLNICREMKAGVEQLSGERIREELFKLLFAPHPVKWLKLLDETEILETVVPSGLSFDGFDMLCAYEDQPHPLRRLALLVPKEDVNGLSERLKLSNGHKKLLQNIHQNLSELTTLQDVKVTRSQIYQYGPDHVEHAFYLFCAKHGFHALSPEQNPHFKEIEQARSTPIVFPLKGRHLLELGYQKGPDMGAVIQFVENWWRTEGCYGDLDACLDYARSIK